MPLTEIAVRNARPREKQFKLTDGGGLRLLVKPTGSKLWQMPYTWAGRELTLSFGPWPDVSIAEARRQREAAKVSLRAGVDPGAAKKAARLAQVAPTDDTFGALAVDWFEAKKAGWSKGYASRVWSRIADDVLPVIGKLPPKEIEPPVILAMVRQVENRGAIEMAKRVKGYCSEVFQFGIAESRAVRDPTKDITKALKKKPPVQHRKKMPVAEMPAFLNGLEVYDGATVTRLMLRLLVQTVVRTMEVRFAHESEFEDLDGPEPLWRIPGPRMKMRSDHLVPLSPQAVATVKEALALPRRSTLGLLFPGDGAEGALSENTLIYALYNLGYHGKATVHGFRGTFSTVANESGLFQPDWIERQLAHVDQDEVRSAYNAALYLPQRRGMMCWWADRLDEWRAAVASI